MAKKSQSIRCSRCNLEFSEEELFDEHADKAFVEGNKILCKDCLVMLGGNPTVAKTYLAYQNDRGTNKPHDWQ